MFRSVHFVAHLGQLQNIMLKKIKISPKLPFLSACLESLRTPYDSCFSYIWQLFAVEFSKVDFFTLSGPSLIYSLLISLLSLTTHSDDLTRDSCIVCVLSLWRALNFFYNQNFRLLRNTKQFISSYSYLCLFLPLVLSVWAG